MKKSRLVCGALLAGSLLTSCLPAMMVSAAPDAEVSPTPSPVVSSAPDWNFRSEYTPIDIDSSGTFGKKEIPVTLSAEATIFDVTVPTAFPIVVDPDTGEVFTADDTQIVNNSFGQVVVQKIEARDNATGDADWHLAAYDTDMTQVAVDSNRLGLMVQPVGGVNAGIGGTKLYTDDSSEVSQVLLDAANSEWVLDGKNQHTTKNILTVNYDANASAVSDNILNKTVANIVITVCWNKAGTIKS